MAEKAKGEMAVAAQESVEVMTDVMTKFTAHIGKRLPSDVKGKLADLRRKETNEMANVLFDSMADNQAAADKLDRPSCQDTGVIQYFITAGAKFPLLGELEEILRNATLGATKLGPLRHNAVEAFDEKNTGTNTGSRIPWLDWEIVPGDDGGNNLFEQNKARFNERKGPTVDRIKTQVGFIR